MNKYYKVSCAETVVTNDTGFEKLEEEGEQYDHFPSHKKGKMPILCSNNFSYLHNCMLHIGSVDFSQGVPQMELTPGMSTQLHEHNCVYMCIRYFK